MSLFASLRPPLGGRTRLVIIIIITRVIVATVSKWLVSKMNLLLLHSGCPWIIALKWVYFLLLYYYYRCYKLFVILVFVIMSVDFCDSVGIDAVEDVLWPVLFMFPFSITACHCCCPILRAKYALVAAVHPSSIWCPSHGYISKTKQDRPIITTGHYHGTLAAFHSARCPPLRDIMI